MFLQIVLSVIFCAFQIEAANILYLATIPSPSHHILNGAITSELAKRGHNLTVISPDIDKNPPKGIHYIYIENQYSDANVEFLKKMLRAKEEVSAFEKAIEWPRTCIEICREEMKTNGFKTLLNYPDDFKFDLIIHDFTCGPCFLPFADKFKNPPLLGITGYSHPSLTPISFGGHQYYAYTPHNSLLSDGNMNFWQRTFNFILYMAEYIYYRQVSIPALNAITKASFGPNTSSVDELEQRTTLAFVNTNPVMDYLIPLPENIIPIAGVHVRDPKPIPQDLKAFIDSSKKGVVIFSLGTNFRSKFMPMEKQNIFLNVFRELPDYHFLWKFESNFPAADLPQNVQIRPWLPISNILADPKVKMIYFHGGMLTTQEALWRGVPMIIMPFGYDQQQNLIKTRRLGVSEGINYVSLNKNETKATILKVLEDPSYALNAKKASARFRDQKEKPLERAVWWIEWLIRNPDSNYLKSPVLGLGLITGNAYDVIAFIICVTAALILASIKIIVICSNHFMAQKLHSKYKEQ